MALATDQERMLQYGEMEVPGTGAYRHVGGVGTYLCVRCGVPLFHSSAQIEDDSGYAAFSAPVQEEAVELQATYTMEGETESMVLCRHCHGHIGRIKDLTFRSDDDLNDGTTKRTYLVSSRAVVFKKALSIRNYPSGFLMFLLLLGAFGYGAWAWVARVAVSTQTGNDGKSVHLWIGSQDVRAALVQVEALHANSNGILLKDTDALMVILNKSFDVQQLTYANHPVHVVWLDALYKIVGFTLSGSSPSDRALSVPDGSAYLLIVRDSAVLTDAIRLGAVVTVTESNASL